MEHIEHDEEMEMPCPCQQCGNWFDLNDGYGSEKWFPNTVICAPCYYVEEKEIERDEDIENAQQNIEEAIYTLAENEKRLIELNVPEFKTNEEKQAVAFYTWICNQRIQGRTTQKLWLDYKNEQS